MHHTHSAMYNVTLLFAAQAEEWLGRLQSDGYFYQPTAFALADTFLSSIRAIPTGKKGKWKSIVNHMYPPMSVPPWRAVLYTQSWPEFNLDSVATTRGVIAWIEQSISQFSPEDSPEEIRPLESQPLCASGLLSLLRSENLYIQVEDLCLLERDPPLPQQFRHYDADPESSSSRCVTLPMVMTLLVGLGPDRVELWPPYVDPYAERCLFCQFFTSTTPVPMLIQLPNPDCNFYMYCYPYCHLYCQSYCQLLCKSYCQPHCKTFVIF